MKYYFIIFLNLYFLNVKSQDYKEIIKKINWEPTRKIMKELFKKGYINNINYNGDTLYILEDYGLATGQRNYMIWNKNSSLNFVYFKNNLEFKEAPSFGEKVIGLVKEWDIIEIKKEIEENEVFSSVSSCYAYRIIIKHKDVKISELYLNQFTW